MLGRDACFEIPGNLTFHVALSSDPSTKQIQIHEKIVESTGRFISEIAM